MFPNAVLSVCWRGGIQMTCVQLWRTRSLGGNHRRCVCVRERQRERERERERGRERAGVGVSPTSLVPVCSHDCVCVSQIHAKSHFAAYASGPVHFSLLTLCLSARKHLFAICFVLYSTNTYSTVA